MRGEDKSTINITLKIEKSQVVNFEHYLDQNLELISYKIIPDTEKLYENDPIFKKLVKAVKDAQLIRDRYINEKNV